MNSRAAISAWLRCSPSRASTSVSRSDTPASARVDALVTGATRSSLPQIRSGPRRIRGYYGCRAGLAVRMATDRGAVVSGLDASAPLLEVARGRTPETVLRTGDIQALPYDDDGFDVVMSFNAIQYAADPAAAVAQ